jgi:hypothetical protein
MELSNITDKVIYDIVEFSPKLPATVKLLITLGRLASLSRCDFDKMSAGSRVGLLQRYNGIQKYLFTVTLYLLSTLGDPLQESRLRIPCGCHK